jgi:Arc/MetJ-type ribon-helix-helix transcriptional regulator
MVRSIPVIPKKRGRPATGVDPLVALRFPPSTIEAIDAWQKRNKVESRSEAIRQLIETSLNDRSARSRSVSNDGALEKKLGKIAKAKPKPVKRAGA